MQVSSSIQNQDFTVIDDYITGLKALLYLQVNSKDFFNLSNSNIRGRATDSPPPIFGRSVNPIPTGGGQIIPIFFTLRHH